MESTGTPFVVVSGNLKLRFTPDTGGYVVAGIGFPGLHTQGDTFEEALANAYDAAEMLVKCPLHKAQAKAAVKGKPAGKRSSIAELAKPRRRALAGY